MKEHKTLLEWKREIKEEIHQRQEYLKLFNDYEQGDLPVYYYKSEWKLEEKQKQLQMIDDIIEMINHQAMNRTFRGHNSIEELGQFTKEIIGE